MKLWVNYTKKISILLILLAIFGVISVLSLRQNNLTMVDLRRNLIKEDQSGDLSSVSVAAKKLQNYVANHMNTSTGRIALQSLYSDNANRIIEKARPPEISSTIYSQATELCKDQLINYGYRSWADCVSNRVGTGKNMDTVFSSIAIDPAIYYLDYVSSRWSLDIAGISLLITTIILLLVCLKVFAWLWQKLTKIISSRHR